MTAPSGGGDTSADSAACCTLRPESARNRGKSAANSWSELAAGDATDASLDVAEDAAVGATYALCAFPEKRARDCPRSGSAPVLTFTHGASWKSRNKP